MRSPANTRGMLKTPAPVPYESSKECSKFNYHSSQPGTQGNCLDWKRIEDKKLVQATKCRRLKGKNTRYRTRTIHWAGSYYTLWSIENEVIASRRINVSTLCAHLSSYSGSSGCWPIFFLSRRYQQGSCNVIVMYFKEIYVYAHYRQFKHIELVSPLPR